MIKLDTSTNTNLDAALDRILGRETAAPEPKAHKASTPRAPRAPKPQPKWHNRFSRFLSKTVGPFITNRARDLALSAIVLGAFVAVFDGAFYSAAAFSFAGASCYAFALMPDALMVLAGAKSRQVGITDAQFKAARSATRFGLAFSLVTNMIAAVLRNAPWLLELSVTVAGHQVRYVHLVGAVVYHGVVVLILWHAYETISKTRSDRKGRNASSKVDALGALAGVAGAVSKSLGRKGSEAVVPAQRRSK